MKAKRSFFLLFFITLCISVQAQEVIRPWEGIRPKSRVRMWHYQSLNDNGLGISVIILPGGSYHHLGIRNEGHDVARVLAEKGYTPFVLRYSTGMYGNSYPTMMEDVQRAVMLVKERAAEFNIDPDKVGVMGFSAGGHLAGWMGTYYDTNYLARYGLNPALSLRPAFVAMIYPVVTMIDGIVHRRSRKNLLPNKHSATLRLQLSLEENVRADMPPVFLLTCMDDPVVDPENSIRYSRALEEKQVPHEFLLYREGGHGFGYKPHGKNKTGHEWIQEFFRWMEHLNQ